MDLLAKFRFFRHLSGGDDPQSETFYRWHIEHRVKERMNAGLPTDKWKRTLSDYTSAAILLHDNMKRDGFDPGSPVPIDPDGELLGGAHRVACALALGIDEIMVVDRPGITCWAPEWGHDWFGMRMDRPDFEIFLAQFKELMNGSNR